MTSTSNQSDRSVQACMGISVSVSKLISSPTNDRVDDDIF